MNRTGKIVPGALVTYRDVNLLDYRGVVVSRDGNRTIVQWYGVALPTVEWAPNLMVRK